MSVFAIYHLVKDQSFIFPPERTLCFADMSILYQLVKKSFLPNSTCFIISVILWQCTLKDALDGHTLLYKCHYDIKMSYFLGVHYLSLGGSKNSIDAVQILQPLPFRILQPSLTTQSSLTPIPPSLTLCEYTFLHAYRIDFQTHYYWMCDA